MRITALALNTIQWKRLQVAIVLGRNFRNVACILREKKNNKKLQWKRSDTLWSGKRERSAKESVEPSATDFCGDEGVNETNRVKQKKKKQQMVK